MYEYKIGEENINNDNYYPEKKSHWKKYKVYYLVFGSFFFISMLMLISKLDTDQEIKKINKRLSLLQKTNEPNDNPENNFWPFDNPGNNHNHNHDYKSGSFVFPSSNQQKENWLEEIVFQDTVRQEFQIWVNSVKYLPKYRLGGQTEPEQHALFYGPPGSGKSYLAEMFAKNEAAAYIFADFGTETYAGSSKKKINKVMGQAANIAKKTQQNKPVVIIIDEIDSVGAKNPALSSASVDEVNGILTMIDEIKRNSLNIIVIGITNYPQLLDPALKRSGRLGRQIQVPYPTKQEIIKMVGHLEKEIKSEKIDAYKYEGNKDKWNKDKWKEAIVEWTSDFWPNVLQITQEAFEKCRQEEVGISYTDVELALKNGLATKISKDSKKITPLSADYETELGKMVENKIKNKPIRIPRPPRREQNPDLPDDDNEN